MNKTHLPETIAADRVVLKKHDPNLAHTMFDYVDVDRDRLLRFLPWVIDTKTVQDEIDYIKMTHDKWDRFEMYDYGIFLKDGETYVGNVGVHTIGWSADRCELGYWILGRFEGQGYMSEAVAALTNHCFKMGFNRIEIRCDPLNERSAHVPKNLGFKFEAQLRQNSLDHNGQHRDSLVFARLKQDGNVLAKKSQKKNRPSFIKHWSETLSADNSHYPNSDELLAYGAPLGKATGLLKIGIHHEILKPGRRTSWPHAESLEEEFVYVVSGSPSAWVDGHLYPLSPGDAVGFPAGTGIAHTFINNTNEDCILLVVGERNIDENKCVYPLHPERNSEIKESLWRDFPKQEMGPHDGLPDRLRLRLSKIETKRLMLEPVTEGHAQEFFDLFSDSSLHTFVPFEVPTIEQQTERCRRWACGASSDGSEIWINWASRDKTSGKMMGHFQAGLTQDQPASIGYVVAKNFQGQGYATEALRAICDFLKTQRNVKTVKAWSDTKNLASHRVAKNLGMEVVDTIKNADFFKGQSSDEFVFSKEL